MIPGKKRLPLFGSRFFHVSGQAGKRASPSKQKSIFEKGLVSSMDESQLSLFYGLSFLCVALPSLLPPTCTCG